MVDFEKDIVSISLGTIIFSEGTGSLTEIGMLSCYPELHKNILIVVDSEFVDDDCISFFNLGPITKIRENAIHNLTNIWAFDRNYNPDEEFKNISTHFLDIITTSNSILIKDKDENHILLLLFDLIVLFPQQNKKFYTDAIKQFNIETQHFNFDKFFSLLKLLGLIETKHSGGNKLFKSKIKNYTPCVKYTGKARKSFDRANFLIEMG